MARLASPILLGVVTVAAILLLTGKGDDSELRENFEIGAVYESGYVEVAYLDKSGKTRSAVLEVLGMGESFQKTIRASEFTEEIPFPGVPENGWKAHPVVLDVDHPDLGRVQLKTEIRQAGDPAPGVIYSRP